MPSASIMEGDRAAEQATGAPAVTEPSGPPPAYEPASVQPSPASCQLPGYEDATKLPSYEEAEKTKAEEAGIPTEPECPERAARQARRAGGFFIWSGTGLLLPDAGRGNVDPSTISHSQLRQQVLGTDLEFLCCFLVAMLFNWFGMFICLCCLTVTIAGRSGAISGFGLSVVKWSFLVMHQTYITRESLGLVTSTEPTAFLTDGVDSDNLSDNKWFTLSCWLIVLLGILCFLQGIIHYVKAKKHAESYEWLRQRYVNRSL